MEKQTVEKKQKIFWMCDIFEPIASRVQYWAVLTGGSSNPFNTVVHEICSEINVT